MLGISGNPFYIGRQANNAWNITNASVPNKLWYSGDTVVLNVSNVSEWTNKSRFSRNGKTSNSIYACFSTRIFKRRCGL